MLLAARCAFAMFREDFGVSHSQIIDQGGETDVSLSSWYCSDDSYEQSIVLNALIDHSLCSTAGGDVRERNPDNGLLFQDLPRPQESINKEYKLLSDEADYLAASLCALENEKDLFPAYPIVQRFWYVECFLDNGEDDAPVFDNGRRRRRIPYFVPIRANIHRN